METEETFYTFDTIEDLEELPTLIFELELQLESINSKLENDNTQNLLTKNVNETKLNVCASPPATKATYFLQKQIRCLCIHQNWIELWEYR